MQAEQFGGTVPSGQHAAAAFEGLQNMAALDFLEREKLICRGCAIIEAAEMLGL